LMAASWPAATRPLAYRRATRRRTHHEEHRDQVPRLGWHDVEGAVDIRDTDAVLSGFSGDLAAWRAAGGAAGLPAARLPRHRLGAWRQSVRQDASTPTAQRRSAAPT
jgi:hypothetical protein